MLPLSSEHGLLLSIDSSYVSSSATGGREVVTRTGSRVSMVVSSVERVALGTTPLAQESIMAGTASVCVCVCVLCVCACVCVCVCIRTEYKQDSYVLCITSVCMEV